MKILSLYYENQRGGLTRRLLALLEGAAGRGHAVHFICSEALPKPSGGIRVHVLNGLPATNVGLRFWTAFIPDAMMASLRLARREGITHIVTFGPFYTALCVLPILLKGIPAITFIRGDNLSHSSRLLRTVFFLILDWVGLKLSDQVVFNSHAMLRVYRTRFRIPEERCAVLPNNIARQLVMPEHERSLVRQSYGAGASEFLFTSAGVFTPGKNFSLLIESLEHLPRGRFRLVLIGDGQPGSGERRRLEELARARGVQDEVIFAGWQHEPQRIIAACDLFVFPSLREGSPNALLEALGCGAPCLGSDIPEIREVLHHEELLFDPHNAAALSAMILKCAQEHALHETLRRLCAERAQVFRFDWMERLLELMHQVKCSTTGGLHPCV